jgi:predicted S18 family serine protease
MLIVAIVYAVQPDLTQVDGFDARRPVALEFVLRSCYIRGMKKIVVTALLLMALASPAFAASKHHHSHQSHQSHHHHHSA